MTIEFNNEGKATDETGNRVRLYKATSPGKDDILCMAPSAAEAISQVDDCFKGCESIAAEAVPFFVRGWGCIEF